MICPAAPVQAHGSGVLQGNPMKRLISLSLAALALLLMASCRDREKKGPTEVDYGNAAYVHYSDDTPLSFDYLDCFKRTEMEDEESFITYTDDRLGVLTYQVYDPTDTSSYAAQQGYNRPGRTYSEILDLTEEEAQNYLKVALGMVGSQDAEYTIDGFAFEKAEGVIRLSMEATAEYGRTGEIQKLWMVKIITSDEYVYTVHAFAPASIVAKYGPAFKNVEFAQNNQ